MPPTPRYEQYGNLGIVEIYREKERERDGNRKDATLFLYGGPAQNRRFFPRGWGLTSDTKSLTNPCTVFIVTR